MKEEENLLELAKDMTDEEVYELSKNIVERLVNKKPIVKRCGYEVEDLLNHQFIYWYEKQRRGNQSPLTLKETITKKHLRNLLYMEFSNAINYLVRSPKSQGMINEIELNFQPTESGDDAQKDFVENALYHKSISAKDECLESSIRAEYNVEKEKLLTFISNDESDSIFIKYNEFSDTPTYKKFSNKNLADYYCNLNKNTKITVKDLDGVLVKQNDDATYSNLDKDTIRALMKNLKEEVSLNLFNNDIGGCYDSFR